MNYLRFKYTKNEDRITWIEGLYPYSHLFLNVITSIPWDGYQPGQIRSYITMEENESENFNFNAKNSAKYTEEKGHVIIKKNPYRIFGGAACEILNSVYPGAGQLHATVDPTADIDVLVEPPIFMVDRELSYDYMYNLYQKDIAKMSPLAENYVYWLFERVVEAMRPVARYFERNASFHVPSPSATPETAIGLRHEAVGPFLVTLLVTEESLIKVQVTTQYLTVADHIIEFVINAIDDYEVKDYSESNTLRLRQYSGIIIENPVKTLETQVDGLIARQDIDETIRYKLINHYGRILYLTKAIRWLVDNKYMGAPYWGKFNTLLKAVKLGLFEKEGVCPPPRGCSLKAVLEPIVLFIEKSAGWKHILLKN